MIPPSPEGGKGSSAFTPGKKRGTLSKGFHLRDGSFSGRGGRGGEETEGEEPRFFALRIGSIRGKRMPPPWNSLDGVSYFLYFLTASSIWSLYFR